MPDGPFLFFPSVMKSFALPLLVACLGASTLAGQVFWGVDASGAVAERGLDPALGGSPNPGNAAEGGGIGWFNDLAAADDSRGSFFSSAALLSDPAAFAQISTFAATTAQVRPSPAALASAVVAAAFRYEGTLPFPLTLEASLHGSFANALNNPSPHAGNFGTVHLYKGLPTAADFRLSLDPLDWAAEGLSFVGAIELAQSDSLNLLSGSLAVPVVAGEILYVVTKGESRIYGPDGVADAASTLLVGFEGATFDLVPLAEGSDLVLIPEPRAAALLTALLAGLSLAGRRRPSPAPASSRP
jgi:hypothetical protein